MSQEETIENNYIMPDDSCGCTYFNELKKKILELTEKVVNGTIEEQEKYDLTLYLHTSEYFVNNNMKGLKIAQPDSDQEETIEFELIPETPEE